VACRFDQRSRGRRAVERSGGGIRVAGRGYRSEGRPEIGGPSNWGDPRFRRYRVRFRFTGRGSTSRRTVWDRRGFRGSLWKPTGPIGAESDNSNVVIGEESFSPPLAALSRHPVGYKKGPQGFSTAGLLMVWLALAASSDALPSI